MPVRAPTEPAWRHTLNTPVAASTSTHVNATVEKRTAAPKRRSRPTMSSATRPPAQTLIASRCTAVAAKPSGTQRPVMPCPPPATTTASRATVITETAPPTLSARTRCTCVATTAETANSTSLASHQ